jgi:hypothetical protein
MTTFEDAASTRAMLLSWFNQDELAICSECGERHVLPGWAAATGTFCVTCGYHEATADTP